MGLFNEHSSTTKTDSSSTQGPSGPQGIGYKLDANGNFDIENKKLTNVQNGDMDRDVMTKSQIEGYVSNKTQYIDNINPGEVKIIKLQYIQIQVAYIAILYISKINISKK